MAALIQLRREGCGLAIDPFTEVQGASGIEELAGLLKIADAVKIDASQDRATLANLLSLARQARVRTVAKNVVSVYETVVLGRSTVSLAQ